MKLHSLLGNSQQLDGGAMSGNAPKALWSRWLTPDADNRVQLACRCLLVQVNGKNILFEAGIGAFFEPKLRDRFGVIESDHILLSSLTKVGLSHEAIDYVVLSHLHFDHAGGLLSIWNEYKKPELLFPNAKFLVSTQAWKRATNPHPRDKASFIPQLNALLQESNRLKFLEENPSLLGSEFTFHISDGHTPGMLLTEVQTPQGPLVFAADLIPGLAWVHTPVTMGYDRYPEMVINEKEKLLNYLAQNKGRLFFTHDPSTACAEISIGERNHFVAVNPISTLLENFS